MSSASLSQGIRLSSTPKMDFHDGASLASIVRFHDKQGITSILSPTKAVTSSLRRTLSADMSSKNWLSRNGLSPKEPYLLPRIEDSSSASSFSSSEEESWGESRVEIWNSIQEEKKRSQDQQPGQFDIWSSIMSQSKCQQSESETLPPPYVHPLVRRSSSCLSEKSLEICTESLGSESGSDGFSSSRSDGFSLSPPLETSDHYGPRDNKGEKDDDLLSSTFSQTDDVQDFDCKRSFHAPAFIQKTKQPPPSFPPPLSSLSPPDGAPLRMRSRRENGRLVLDAISIPSPKNFHACRENGRLVLAFRAPDTVHSDCVVIGNREREEEEEEEEMEEDEERGDGDDDVADKEEEEGIEWIISKKPESVEIANLPKINCGKLRIPKIAIMMNKPNEVSEVVFFKGINEGDEINSMPIKLPQALAEPAATTAADPLNVYEYFWRTKPSATTTVVMDPGESMQSPLALKSYRSKNYMISTNDDGRDSSSNERHGVRIVLKECNNNSRLSMDMEACWVSVMRAACNDSRRSLLLLKPRCIATS